MYDGSKTHPIIKLLVVGLKPLESWCMANSLTQVCQVTLLVPVHLRQKYGKTLLFWKITVKREQRVWKEGGYLV